MEPDIKMESEDIWGLLGHVVGVAMMLTIVFGSLIWRLNHPIPEIGDLIVFEGDVVVSSTVSAKQNDKVCLLNTAQMNSHHGSISVQRKTMDDAFSAIWIGGQANDITGCQSGVVFNISSENLSKLELATQKVEPLGQPKGLMSPAI